MRKGRRFTRPLPPQGGYTGQSQQLYEAMIRHIEENEREDAETEAASNKYIAELERRVAYLEKVAGVGSGRE